MTTISWLKNVISHGGHSDTIREYQMMVTTKNFLSIDLSLVSMKPWLRSFFANRTDRCGKSW